MNARVRYDDSLPAEVQALLEEKDKEIEDLKEQKLRLHAEFENYRKRLNRKADEKQKFALQPLVLEILDAVDDFEHAFHPDNLKGERDAMLQGFFQICLKIMSTLQNHGVCRIETENVLFDPNLHEAVRVEPSEFETNTIICTTRNGYMLHDRIIRVAQVALAGPPAHPTSP